MSWVDELFSHAPRSRGPFITTLVLGELAIHWRPIFLVFKYPVATDAAVAVDTIQWEVDRIPAAARWWTLAIAVVVAALYPFLASALRVLSEFAWRLFELGRDYVRGIHVTRAEAASHAEDIRKLSGLVGSNEDVIVSLWQEKLQDQGIAAFNKVALGRFYSPIAGQLGSAVSNKDVVFAFASLPSGRVLAARQYFEMRHSDVMSRYLGNDGSQSHGLEEGMSTAAYLEPDDAKGPNRWRIVKGPARYPAPDSKVGIPTVTVEPPK